MDLIQYMENKGFLLYSFNSMETLNTFCKLNKDKILEAVNHYDKEFSKYKIFIKSKEVL